MNIESVADARRAATPRAADRPAWGWPSEGVERERKPAATPMKMRPVCPCLFCYGGVAGGTLNISWKKIISLEKNL